MGARLLHHVRYVGAALFVGLAPPASAQQQPQQHVQVPTSAPAETKEQNFRDAQFGVRFKVPPGWEITRHDHEVSTFHLDARTAPPNLQMRSVASLDFNPFPQSTLAGAMVYYSVEKHAKATECLQQAAGKIEPTDTQEIGGMNFVHGHDEHGGVCVEARDEIYTAYRKGACYRFDLELNTFCAVSSGAAEMTEKQMADIETRMTGILSTVTLDWSKTGAHPVPPAPQTQRKKLPAPAGTAGDNSSN
jgi:hypothetical protein